MGKKRKIVFVSAYWKSVERGAEVFVKELSERLSLKYEVVIVGGRVNPRSRWPVVWRVFLDPAGLSILWFTLRNIGRIWGGKYDFIVPIDGGWQALLLRLLAWFRGGKLVISGQSGIGWDDRVNLWLFPDTFVALTDYAAKWVRAVNKFVRVETITNGVDVKTFNPQVAPIKLGLSKPIILSVGALTDYKRLDLIIKAVAKLDKGSLLLVGKGERRGHLQKMGDKLLPGRFAIKSYLHTEMSNVYTSADTFTYPTSSTESFGIAMVEAMASGLPVVANDDPIRREIVGGAGLFINPTDTDRYAKTLQKALSASWGNKPRKQAEKFDWDEIAKEYEKLFRSLIK